MSRASRVVTPSAKYQLAAAAVAHALGVADLAPRHALLNHDSAAFDVDLGGDVRGRRDLGEVDRGRGVGCKRQASCRGVAFVRHDGEQRGQLGLGRVRDRHEAGHAAVGRGGNAQDRTMSTSPR